MGSYHCSYSFATHLPHKKAMTYHTCVIWQLTSSDIFPSSFIAPIVPTRDDTEWGCSWARWIAYRSFFKMPETSPYKKTKRLRLMTFWQSHGFKYFAQPKIISLYKSARAYKFTYNRLNSFKDCSVMSWEALTPRY